jgi:hypothetical protein
MELSINGMKNKMNIDDLFQIDDDFDKVPQMTTDEFVSKTRDILSKIDTEYSHNYHSRRITSEEYKLCDCKNCKGECFIKIDNKELHCVPDHMDGDCFIKYFNYEGFTEEIEDIIFVDPKYSFYELLNCEVKEIPKSDESKWNMIPDKCEFDGKIYSILDIDLQGGFFTLYNPEAEVGEIQVLNDVDMDLCNVISSEDIIRKTLEAEYGENPTTKQKLDFVNNFSKNTNYSKDFIMNVLLGKNNI